MSIIEEYEKSLDLLKEEHKKKVEKLDQKLRAKQKDCEHKERSFHEDLFYAMGQTCPGYVCEECGLRMRKTYNDY